MTDDVRYLYLDNVVVFDIYASSNPLLLNDDFESSTAAPVYWNDWCGNYCKGKQGFIESSSNCYGGSGNCYGNNCGPGNVVELLSQSFSATVRNWYSITFVLSLTGNGAISGTSLSVSIY